MKITLLGCGRWGGFIAWYLDKNNMQVKVWGLETDPYVVNLFKTRQNDYLQFPQSIQFTHNLEDAINFGEYIIISISSQNLSDLMSKVKKCTNYKDKKFVLCMKGIEDATGRRLSEVLIANGVKKSNIATWVGPGHVQEFIRGVPNCMIIDAYDKNLSANLIELFKSDLIRYYHGSDMIGTEIGAAAKNVMGIAAGVLDGGGFSVLKGALMARGAREIARLIKAAGGNELSAYGLCHLGDYEATLFSQHSHNRKFGEMLVKGEQFDKLAEGVSTASALLKMAKKYKVELPITNAVNDIIVNKKTAIDVLLTLFSRPNKTEFY